MLHQPHKLVILFPRDQLPTTPSQVEATHVADNPDPPDPEAGAPRGVGAPTEAVEVEVEVSPTPTAEEEAGHKAAIAIPTNEAMPVLPVFPLMKKGFCKHTELPKIHND